MSSTLVEIIGIIAATLTTISWVPQAWKTIRTRQTRDISLIAQITLFIGIALWLIYGLAINSWPLIGANVVTFALIAVILTMKLRHG
jgi:MtN3 and saliva related transmembrane protein